VLALVERERERERKVSVIEAWSVLQTTGSEPMRYNARVLAKGTKEV
jgi:hypothetical protein